MNNFVKDNKELDWCDCTGIAGEMDDYFSKYGGKEPARLRGKFYQFYNILLEKQNNKSKEPIKFNLTKEDIDLSIKILKDLDRLRPKYYYEYYISKIRNIKPS